MELIKKSKFFIYFAFIGTLISLITLIISIILYIQADASFSFFTHFISFLGVGPNNSDIVFNVGIIISALFFPFFYVYLGGFLNDRVKGNRDKILIALVAIVLNCVGNIILAVFNNNLNLLLHLVGAYIAFGAFFILACIYSYLELNIPEFNTLIALSGFIPCIFLLLHMVLLFILYYTGIFPALPILIEWIGYFIMAAWIVLQGVYLLFWNND